MVEISEMYEMYRDNLAQAGEALTNPDGFKIATPEQAEWALRKLKKLNEKAEQTKEYYESELNTLKTFFDNETERINREKSYFEGLLMEYHQPQYEQDPKSNKTLRFPSGQITFRKQQPDFTRDDEKLTKWVKINKPDLLKVVESANWSELKKSCSIVDGKLITTDGEIVEGVTVTDRPEKFEVKLG